MYPTHEPVGVGISPRAERALAAYPVPPRSRPDRDDPKWLSVVELLDPAAWREIDQRYSAHLGTPHLAPGLLCSLQHYTGRALGLTVAAWCADGTLLDPSHERWWAHIDAAGATLEVSLPDLPTLGRDRDPGALIDVLRSHVDPLVDACIAAGTVTRRAALGGAAASCAGAFGIAHRSVSASRRGEVEAGARVVAAALSERPLVTMVRLTDPPALVHDRHTCCLIRLGSDNSECESCPQLTENERRSRQRLRARRVLANAGGTR